MRDTWFEVLNAPRTLGQAAHVVHELRRAASQAIATRPVLCRARGRALRTAGLVADTPSVAHIHPI
jgi:hypothetical protein